MPDINTFLDAEKLATLVNTDPFLLFFGSFFIVIGFSAFTTPKSWNEFIDLFVENDVLSLVMGVFMLPISLSIIVFYNSWDPFASLVLMVIGYLAFVKTLILLLKPKLIQSALNTQFVRKWIWLDGVSGILLGGVLLFL